MSKECEKIGNMWKKYQRYEKILKKCEKNILKNVAWALHEGNTQ